MRILIAADIEGVAGVCHPEQTKPGNSEYERARRLMCAEVNAAAEGAFAGGADEVWVVDGHGTYRNLLIEDLHPDLRLINGKPRLGGMLAGLVEYAPWDGLFLVGYHARAGSHGVLAHTINGSAFALISVDGRAVGEAFLNCAVAGEQGVPVRLISGDDCLAAEVAPFAHGAEVVTVKQALGNRAAAHLPLSVVREALRNAAEHAVTRPVQPLTLSGPLWVEVTSCQAAQADVFSLIPGVERLYSNSVGFEADSATSLVRMINSFSAMSSSLG